MIVLILSLLAITLAAAVYTRKYHVWCGTVFLFGMLCMVFSNVLYMRTLTNVNLNSVGADPFVVKLAGWLSLSISRMREISLIGEICVLIFFIMILANMIRKKKWRYTVLIVSAVFLCVYTYFNLPDTMFHFYLRINSADLRAASRAESLFGMMQGVRYLILLCIMTSPYIVGFYKYRASCFAITKKRMLNILLLTVSAEVILFFCIALNLINDFTKMSTEIFYRGKVPEVYEVNGYMVAAVILLILLAGIIIIKGDLSLKYYTKINIKGIYETDKLDKNIKMILHTYKNMFFAVRQLSDEAIYDETLSENSKMLIGTIHDLSEKALYGITKQIGMLSELKIEMERFEISESIDQAVENFMDKERCLIKINYQTNEKFICSDSFYLSEAIYNILKNAIEATNNINEAKIEVNVKYEESWFLIEIIDNGCGIDRKKIKEIFKPLISYKNGCNNWGIGLYYSYKIICTLKGYLYVRSQVQEYTKFQIYLPQNIKTRRERRKHRV